VSFGRSNTACGLQPPWLCPTEVVWSKDKEYRQCRCTRTALVTAPFLFGTIINAAFLEAGASPADPDQDTVIRAVEDAKRVLNIFPPGQRDAVRTVGGVA